MPSPFPGIDPFIEDQKWQDFHARFITVLGELLLPDVRPRYEVEVQQYVFVEESDADRIAAIEPDVAIAERPPAWATVGGKGAAVAAVAAKTYTLPQPHHIRQNFLTIKSQGRTVVTIIELLSPWNKSPGDGRRQYLDKRNGIFVTPTHLVEIDLLRAGRRLPTVEPLEEADFFAFISHSELRPSVEVLSWSLRQPLPVMPIPLCGDDAPALLELQTAFDLTCDRAGYDYALDYDQPPLAALSEQDAKWCSERLMARGRP